MSAGLAMRRSRCTEAFHEAIATGPREAWIARTLPLVHTGERSIALGLEYADCARCVCGTRSGIVGRTTLVRHVACVSCGIPVDGPEFCSPECERLEAVGDAVRKPGREGAVEPTGSADGLRVWIAGIQPR
jgi:hypothetical protein